MLQSHECDGGLARAVEGQGGTHIPDSGTLLLLATDSKPVPSDVRWNPGPALWHFLGVTLAPPRLLLLTQTVPSSSDQFRQVALWVSRKLRFEEVCVGVIDAKPKFLDEWRVEPV